MEIVPARMLKVTRRRWSEGVFRLGTRPFVRTTDERSRRRGRGRRKRGMGGKEERLMCSEGRRDAHCEPRCRCSLGFFLFFFPLSSSLGRRTLHHGRVFPPGPPPSPLSLCPTLPRRKPDLLVFSATVRDKSREWGCGND